MLGHKPGWLDVTVSAKNLLNLVKLDNGVVRRIAVGVLLISMSRSEEDRNIASKADSLQNTPRGGWDLLPSTIPKQEKAAIFWIQPMFSSLLSTWNIPESRNPRAKERQENELEGASHQLATLPDLLLKRLGSSWEMPPSSSTLPDLLLKRLGSSWEMPPSRGGGPHSSSAVEPTQQKLQTVLFNKAAQKISNQLDSLPDLGAIRNSLPDLGAVGDGIKNSFPGLDLNIGMDFMEEDFTRSSLDYDLDKDIVPQKQVNKNVGFLNVDAMTSDIKKAWNNVTKKIEYLQTNFLQDISKPIVDAQKVENQTKTKTSTDFFVSLDVMGSILKDFTKRIFPFDSSMDASDTNIENHFMLPHLFSKKRSSQNRVKREEPKNQKFDDSNFLQVEHREVMLPGYGVAGDIVNDIFSSVLNTITVWIYKHSAGDCAKKLICESHRDIFGRGFLVPSVLTYISTFALSLLVPGRPSDTLMAARQGRNGADCTSQYPNCSIHL